MAATSIGQPIMKCPACEKTAVSFLTWWTASPFKWRCPHCSTPLEVSRHTQRWYIACFFVCAAALFVAVIAFEESGYIDEGQGKPLVLAGTLFVFALCYSLAYARGAYVTRESCSALQAPPGLLAIVCIWVLLASVDLIRTGPDAWSRIIGVVLATAAVLRLAFNGHHGRGAHASATREPEGSG